MRKVPFNKVCELEDFDDPELACLIRDVCRQKADYFAASPVSPHPYPKGAEHRKDWEVAMAVRALDRFGALRPDATVLGVAAGIEDTLFYLTRRVRQVFATDRYLMPADWVAVAPPLMLVEPSDVAPYDFDLERLVVQHMDGRSLRYPADTFDGVFSSGSIEHFGELPDVANAAYEMGRVLKPGGVLSLSTEFMLSGPPGGRGWPGRTLVLSPENLQHYIVEASGLTLVDRFDPTVSEATLVMPRDIAAHLATFEERKAAQACSRDPKPEFTLIEFPHLVMHQQDYVFCSVHLTLRKTDPYPAVPNAWAKPPASTLAAISAYNRRVAQPRAAPSAVAATSAPPVAVEARPPAPPAAPPPAPPAAPPHHVRAQVADAIRSFAHQARERRDHADELLRGTDRAREEVDLSFDAMARLRSSLDARLAKPDLAAHVPNVRDPAAPESEGWTTTEVTMLNGPSFVAVVEQAATDGITQCLVRGGELNHPLVALMLQMVPPGSRVLDLGAHVGLFSLAAAAAGCRVLAVEGSPTNAALLRHAARLNGFQDLHVVNAVVSDTPGTQEFVANGPWGHVVWDAAAESHAITLDAVTVEDVLPEYGWDQPSFIKLDVEGSEIEALGGMATLLSRPDAPAIVYESNGYALKFAGHSPRELWATVESLGYTNYLVGAESLTRLSPGDVQVQTVVDCLALKRRPAGLEGWDIRSSLTQEELVSRIVAEACHPVAECRTYVGGVLASMDAAVLTLPAVTAAIEGMLRDPVEAVRASVSWYRPAPGDPSDAPRTGMQDRAEVTLPCP